MLDKRLLKRAKRILRVAGSDERAQELINALNAQPNLDVARYALHLAEKGSWDSAIKIAKEAVKMDTVKVADVKDGDLVEVTEGGKQVFRTVGELKATGYIGNRENAAMLVESPAIEPGSVVDQVINGLIQGSPHSAGKGAFPYESDAVSAKFIKNHPNLLDTRRRPAGEIAKVGEVTWKVGEAFIAADGSALWFGNDFKPLSGTVEATFEKVDSIKKELPNKPTNRDRLLKALNSVLRMPKRVTRDKKYVDFVGESLREAARSAEWFDFGHIDAETLIDCAEDARRMADEGLIFLPYPSVVFRARVVTEDAAAEFALLCEDYRASKSDEPARNKQFLTIYALQIRGLDSQIADTRDIIGFDLTDPRKSRVVSSDNEESVHLMQLFLALWMILNTKNVRREIIIPDLKQNKARAAAGKPPAKPVTRIDTQQYVTALRQTQLAERAEHQGGTHRSPKPHLRRAHIRRYRDDHGAVRKVRKIDAMIVNGSEALKVAKRERYKVEAA